MYIKVYLNSDIRLFYFSKIFITFINSFKFIVNRLLVINDYFIIIFAYFITRLTVSTDRSSFITFFPYFLINWHSRQGRSRIASNYSYSMHCSFIIWMIIYTNYPLSFFLFSLFLFICSIKSLNNIWYS